MKTNILIVVLTCLLISGCDTEKQKHVIHENGTERGVPINVMLVGGGTAKLICPKFNGRPSGSHGRECYLDSYNYGNQQRENLYEQRRTNE